MKKAAAKMLARQRDTDAPANSPDAREAKQQLARLQQEAQQLRDWSGTHLQDRRGAKGSVRPANRTDNESAEMATAKGVIQGYTGAAVVAAQPPHLRAPVQLPAPAGTHRHAPVNGGVGWHALVHALMFHLTCAGSGRTATALDTVRTDDQGDGRRLI